MSKKFRKLVLRRNRLIVRNKQITNIKAQRKLYRRRLILSRRFCRQIILKVPTVFSIESNTKKTMRFFRLLKDSWNNCEQGRKIFIDSSNVRRLSESSLMYLYAMIAETKSRKVQIGGNYPKNQIAKRIYQRTGFRSVLEYDKSEEDISLTKTSQLYRSRSVQPSIVKGVCWKIQEFLGFKVNLLYEALIELMGNTFDHAYQGTTNYDKKWQLFIMKKGEFAVIVFLDTGFGIPKTVRKKFTDHLKGYVDKDLLASALRGEYRSETGESNRGLGLGQISHFFAQSIVVDTLIYSGKGLLRRDEEGVNRFYDMQFTLSGVLFCFVLKGENNGKKN